MAYKIRRSQERQYFDHGWLKTYHTFSFGDYYDPNYTGFRSLRVINEDRVAPGEGFPLHDHHDMEIISLVLEGELAHKDSMGTESVLKANEVQVMSAGKGIEHSEYNPSKANDVHFLQIWILPEARGLTPQYQQAPLPSLMNQWILIASKDGREHSLILQQDVDLYKIVLEEGKKIEKTLPPDRYGWLQVIEGELKFNEDLLKRGDGVAIEPGTSLKLQASRPSKILLFVLA